MKSEEFNKLVEQVRETNTGDAVLQEFAFQCARAAIGCLGDKANKLAVEAYLMLKEKFYYSGKSVFAWIARKMVSIAAFGTIGTVRDCYNAIRSLTFYDEVMRAQACAYSLASVRYGKFFDEEKELESEYEILIGELNYLNDRRNPKT